jgi:hypothetical protein
MSDKKNAVCNTCTVRLVNIAYERAPWFRLAREPLRLAMRGLAWLHRVDASEYEVRTAGCPRFYQVALKEKSALVRWLNNRINPVFDAMLERIVTEEEVRSAKVYAREATAGGDETRRVFRNPSGRCLAAQQGAGAVDPAAVGERDQGGDRAEGHAAGAELAEAPRG